VLVTGNDDRMTSRQKLSVDVDPFEAVKLKFIVHRSTIDMTIEQLDMMNYL